MGTGLLAIAQVQFGKQNASMCLERMNDGYTFFLLFIVVIIITVSVCELGAGYLYSIQVVYELSFKC